MRIRIRGGRVIDPGLIDGIMDIEIENNRIVRVGGREEDSSAGHSENAEEIDATGCYVVPGLIDMHVHLREPGEEYKETIATGIAAAAAGGFTAICCMPNTRPVNDSRQVTEYIIDTARRLESVMVHPVGAVSMGLNGRDLCEYGDLKEAGAIAVSDDGNPVSDAQLMRRALEYARGVGLPVMSHCEERSLSAGVMNEGVIATRLGLSGIPNAAEAVMVQRDLLLSELTGTPVHIAHVSTRESVEAIRAAKSKGIPVTAETAPHYFTLTDEAVLGYDTHAKMNPPLRTHADRDAIRSGLADGTIDAVATDHAPHTVLEKELEFDAAANGIIGLETSLALGLKLAGENIVSLDRLIEAMSTRPAQILGLSRSIAAGEAAHLTIIDPARTWVYEAAKGKSRSKNTPFDGWKFTGQAVYTIVGGRIVYKAEAKKTYRRIRL